MKKESENDPLGFWDLIVDFGKEQESCRVTFIANGGYFESGENNENKSDRVTYTIAPGNYFYPTIEFPKVDHPDNLTFVGWYAIKDENNYTITPTSTKFTDLTIVNTDIILIAIWQE